MKLVLFAVRVRLLKESHVSNRVVQLENTRQVRPPREDYFVEFTHPGLWRIAAGTHPITSQVVDHAREGGVPALGDGHVFQRVAEIGLIAKRWNKPQIT